MFGDCVDMRPCAGRSGHEFFNECHKSIAVGADIAIKIHQLQNEIDSFCGGVRFGRCHNVSFPHHRNISLNDKAAASIAISYNGPTNDDPLMRFQLNLEGH
jgi:hypothetical protein